jgi:hypothetical protein
MKLDSIERRFVFRISRGLYLFIVGLVAVGLFGAACVFLYSLSPTLKKGDPAKPELPAVSKISAEEVAKILAGEKDKSLPFIPPAVSYEGEGEGEEPPPADATTTNPDMLKIKELMEKIHVQFFPGETSLWTPLFETVCKQHHYFLVNKCLSWGKRKVRDGIKENMEKEMKDWKNEERIKYLESILAVLQTLPKPEAPPAPTPVTEAAAETNPTEDTVQEPPKKQKENIHLVAIACLTDIARAYRGTPKEVVDQIVVMLQASEKESSKEKKVVSFSDDQKMEVFKVLLAIRKRESQTGTLAAYLKSWFEIRPLFNDEKMMEGLGNIWNAVKPLFPDQVAPTLAVIKEIITPIAMEDRPRAVSIFDQLMKEKMAASQMKYNMAMAEFESELAQIEVDYNTRKGAKTLLRYPALMGIGGSILGIAFIGLILALLGIERNTRTLEELLARMSEDRTDLMKKVG